MNILIGADPELFVYKGNTAISAEPFIPGTKENPFKVEEGAVQLDGFAAEFNIDPVDSEELFVSRVSHVLEQLKKFLPEGHELCATPVAHFTKEYMDAQPNKVKMLGCDPDFNAYTRSHNPIPDNDALFRTGSGHIHIGWGTGFDPMSAGHFDDCTKLAKAMDIFVGVPSVIFDRDGAERRKLYGKAGCFRPKPYGMEYRVLSNFWVNDEEYRRYVYRRTHQAFNALVEGDINSLQYDPTYAINFDEPDAYREAKWIMEETKGGLNEVL